MQKETTVFELKSEQERINFVQEHLMQVQFKKMIGLPLSVEEKAALHVGAVIADQVNQDMLDLIKEEGIEFVFEEGFVPQLHELQLVILNKDNKKFIIFQEQSPGNMLCGTKTPDYKEQLQVHKEALSEYNPQLYTVPGVLGLAEKLNEAAPELVYVDTLDRSHEDPEEQKGQMALAEINPEWIAEYEHEELFS